jgi:hypothetical protein
VTAGLALVLICGDVEDIVSDPYQALDPEALQEVEQYFERRLREKPTASTGSVTTPRPST